MSNRFDLEEDIMSAWGIIEDLKTLSTGVMERDLDQDKIANILIGLEQLYELKFEKLWDTFEAMIRDGRLR